LTDIYEPNVTKRLVIPEAEEFLFKPIDLGNGQSVMLVDYQGGDDMVERVATQGYGSEALGLTQGQLFDHMAALGITGPRGEAAGFKSTQLKFRIVSSIYNSLRMVHSQEGNVNEESLRYSLPRGLFNVPSPQVLMDVGGMSEANAIRAYRLMRNVNAHALMDYTEMADDAEVGSASMARELSRLPLTGQLLTGFYWKNDLYSLGRFARAAKLRGNDTQGFMSIAAAIEEITSAVAPKGLDAIMSDGAVQVVNMPNHFVRSGFLKEAYWDPSITRRLVNDELEEILFDPFHYSNVGSLQAVDYMGDDSSVAQAARVSYSKGTKKVSEDMGLLRYLYRNRHTSPFEMVEIAMEGQDPWFSVPRQAGRHRTIDWAIGVLGTLIPTETIYIPEGEKMAYQSSDNKQGRKGEVSGEHRQRITELLNENQRISIDARRQMENMGLDQDTIASNSAMGFNNPWYGSSDFHNWANFLSLRWHSHAQAEVREMAEAVAQAVGASAPISMQAFQDYRRNGLAFSNPEIEVLREIVNTEISEERLKDLGLTNARERQEFLGKLKRLNSN